VHLQFKGGGRYERNVMDDSKCVVGERSMFVHTGGSQPVKWCKLVEQHQGTGLPQRYMVFVVERRTIDAENLREEQNKLDYDAIQKRWCQLLDGIFQVHSFTLLGSRNYVDYQHSDEALCVFNKEWNELESAIHTGSMNYEASHHVTAGQAQGCHPDFAGNFAGGYRLLQSRLEKIHHKCVKSICCDFAIKDDRSCILDDG
jgi:hypothetical protein